MSTRIDGEDYHDFAAYSQLASHEFHASIKINVNDFTQISNFDFEIVVSCQYATKDLC